jgi:hypothetical protein
MDAHWERTTDFVYLFTLASDATGKLIIHGNSIWKK